LVEYTILPGGYPVPSGKELPHASTRCFYQMPQRGGSLKITLRNDLVSMVINFYNQRTTKFNAKVLLFKVSISISCHESCDRVVKWM
jgi:hypothetical protein